MIALATCTASCDRAKAPPESAPVASSATPAAPRAGLRYRVLPRAETPVVSFVFPPPLEIYGGEAKDVSGSLTIDPGLGVASLRGFIEVKTPSVTLGDPEIDENAHSAMFMNVEKHPVSRFDITAVEDPSGVGISVSTSGPASFIMLGDFTLKGITIPIRVPASLEIIPDASGALPGQSAAPPGLLLKASWEINILKPFEIPGPASGEAAERVIFSAELRLGLEK